MTYVFTWDGNIIASCGELRDALWIYNNYAGVPEAHPTLKQFWSTLTPEIQDIVDDVGCAEFEVREYVDDDYRIVASKIIERSDEDGGWVARVLK